MKNHETLLQIAERAALEAGKEILKIYASDFDVKHKADSSPLTLADNEANRVIMQLLRTTNLPIISEENKEIPFKERKDWTTFWLVDPLDGTKEFVKRNGEFTVNIALIEQGIPVMGVIYVPVKKVLYIGDASGAFKINDIETFDELTYKKTSELNPQKPLRNVIVVASRSHLSEETEHFIQKIKEQKNNQSVEVISAGSSLKMCMVAEGKADVYPRFAPTMEWDVAAGHAICRAAGVKVVEAKTQQELKYNKEKLLNPWFVVGNKFGSTLESP